MDVGNVLTKVLVAVLAAVLVGLLFSVVDAVDEYASVAGVITFVVVLLAGVLNGRERL